MERGVVYAAGGIVWKKISGEYKIALVYRERYGGKWSLPKGKLEQNESWREAALREIQEEVGVKARIIKYAGTVNYFADNDPKVVIFWHMKATGSSSITSDPEVVKMEWLTPEEALKKIDYEDERQLLIGLQFPGIRSTERIRGLLRYVNPIRIFRLILDNKSKSERLEGSLKTFRVELDHLIEREQAEKNNEAPSWGVKATTLLNNAERELQNDKINIAWKNFHGSRRMRLYGLTERELNDEAKIIRMESAKLNTWRRDATFALIGSAENPEPNLNAYSVYNAARILDEHYSNNYYKNQLAQNVFTVLLSMMSVIIFLISVYFYVEDIPSLIDIDGEGEIQSVNYLHLGTGILLFGLFGGCISAIFRTRDSSNVTRIPEIINNNFVTLTRVLIGGGSALVIFIFLQSGFAEVLLEGVELQPDNPFTYFALSFVAGFSERLLLRAVSSIVGKE